MDSHQGKDPEQTDQKQSHTRDCTGRDLHLHWAGRVGTDLFAHQRLGQRRNHDEEALQDIPSITSAEAVPIPKVVLVLGRWRQPPTSKGRVVSRIPGGPF